MKQGDTGVQGDTQGDTPPVVPSRAKKHPSVQQVLQTAYHLIGTVGFVSITPDLMIPPDQLATKREADEGDLGDGVLEVLLREAVFTDDYEEVNSEEHWRLARQRVATIAEEVQAVNIALHTFGP